MTKVEQARWEKKKERFVERIERIARTAILNQEQHGCDELSLFENHSMY